MWKPKLIWYTAHARANVPTTHSVLGALWLNLTAFSTAHTHEAVMDLSH